MSWLRAGLGALRATVRIAALLAGLRSFAMSRLRASAKALEEELRGYGLPVEAVRELVREYLERGEEAIKTFVSLKGIGKFIRDIGGLGGAS